MSRISERNMFNRRLTPQQQECVMRVKQCFLIFILLMILILPACKSLKMTPIIKATDQGQLDDVNQQLAQGVDVNTATEEGVTPLFIASLKGHEDIARRLIDQGADVNAKIKLMFKYADQTLYEGCTSLMAALSKKHTDIAKMLIQQGADVKAVDINGATPLFIAAALNDESVVKILIEKGADVNAVILTEYEYKGEPVYKGATALMAALKTKQNANAALLIAHGADVSAKCENGTDALMIAAANGDHPMQEYLLSKGADPLTKLTKECTVIAGQPAFEGGTSLMMAADAGDIDSVTALIKAGSDVNAVTKNGITPLIAAAFKDKLEVVKVLVENGADVNARTIEPYNIGLEAVHKGTSPLNAASMAGHGDIVKFLIESGADVNAKDDFGMDALFLASDKGYSQVAKILIENNADVFCVDSGRTALDAAKRCGDMYIVDLIEDARKKAQESEKD
ncbi:MAG: hypothetical protein COX19_01190 [Desulfobacterales bacterium CG23_combo_of_CG06-09_8_20_14_all_51_8]|nr:MAG: hypothetical protein COX19_01190 [Desulfobacterales bacterium CG23_combo_of_CG06-09_8_20_14_all_51_8]